MTIARLRELINETHQHGVKLGNEIRALEAKGRHGVTVQTKKVLLKGLEVLNAHRRKELTKLEKEQPTPKPTPPVPPKPAPKPAPARFQMFDSTNASNIPPGSVAVAGYADGAFANIGDMIRDFPRAKHLSIAVNSAVDASCLDIETGDAVPADAPGWVRRQHARGLKRPVVYANTSTIAEVVDALTNDGIKRSEYLVWTAHYTGVPHVEPGSDATQFMDFQERYDVSLCEPWFLA